ISEGGPGPDAGLVEGDGTAGDAARQADEAASGGLGTWQTAFEQSDRFRRFRNSRDVVGAADPRTKGPDVFAFGNAGLNGQRAAVCHCFADRLPEPAMCRVRW